MKHVIYKLIADTHCCQFIEAGKEFVEQLHELLGATGRRQLSEAHNVSKEDTATKVQMLQSNTSFKAFQ